MQLQQSMELMQSEEAGSNAPFSGRAAAHFEVRWEAKCHTASAWWADMAGDFARRSTTSQSGISEARESKQVRGFGGGVVEFIFDDSRLDNGGKLVRDRLVDPKRSFANEPDRECV